MKNSIRFSLTTTPMDQSSGTATVQLTHNEFETPSDIVVFQQVGFVSNPPVGTGVITLAPHNDASKKFVIATHNPHTRYVGLPADGTCMHSPSNSASINIVGNEISFIVGGVVIGTITGSNWTINTNMTVNGNLTVDGSINATGNIHATGTVHGINI